MILVCGIPSEPPVARVLDHLAGLGAPWVCFNQRQTPSTSVDFSVAEGRVTGTLKLAGRLLRLEDVTGVYTRMMDEQLLPELRGEAPGSATRLRAQSVTIGLTNWMEMAAARVVNRASRMVSNDSKPFQAQLIRPHGLGIPDTLITNDLEQLVAFRQQHRHVVYKSISSTRSIVRELSDEDLPRLANSLPACPVQFQERIDGLDVRVHVVGTRAFATAARTACADYRYAAQDGAPARLMEFDLDDDLAQCCVRLTADLGLLFSGIDLKITPDGRAYCFEVNCCPGYSYFEAHTGQQISLALAQLLAGQ